MTNNPVAAGKPPAYHSARLAANRPVLSPRRDSNGARPTVKDKQAE